MKRQQTYNKKQFNNNKNEHTIFFSDTEINNSKKTIRITPISENKNNTKKSNLISLSNTFLKNPNYQKNKKIFNIINHFNIPIKNVQMNINKYNIKYYLIEENSKKKLSGKNIKKIIRPKSASDLNINDKNSNLIYNFKNGNPRKFLSNNSLKSIMTTSNYFKNNSNKNIRQQISKDNISITSDNYSRNTSRFNSLISKIDKKETNYFNSFNKYKLLDKPKKFLHRQFTLNNITRFKTNEKLDNLLISDDINTDDKTLTFLTLMSPKCNSSKKVRNNLNRQYSNLSETLSMNSIKKRNLDDLSIENYFFNSQKNNKQLIEKSNDNINNSYNVGKNIRNNKKLNSKKIKIKNFHTTKLLPRYSKAKILKLLFQSKETILSNKFLKNIKGKTNVNNELINHTESQQNFLFKLEKDIYDNYEINVIIEKKDKKNALFINNFEYDYFENLTTIEKNKMNNKIKEIFENNIYSNHLIDHLKDFKKLNIKNINKFDRSFYKKYLHKFLYLIRLNFYINSITTSFLFDTSLDMREEGIFYLLNNDDFISNNRINRLKSKAHFTYKLSQIIKEKKMIKSKTLVQRNHKYKIKEKNKINVLLNIANKKTSNFLFIKDYIYRDTLYQISLTENFENRITYIKAKIISELRKDNIRKEKEIEKINKIKNGTTEEEDNYNSDDELPIKNMFKEKTKRKLIYQKRISNNNFISKLNEKLKRKSSNNIFSFENKLLDYNFKRTSKKNLSTREILGDNMINFFSHHRKKKKIIKPKRQKKNIQTIKMSSQSVTNLFSSRNKLITLLKTHEIKAEILKNIGDNIYKRIFFHIKETNDYEIKRLIKNNIDYINMNYQDENGDTFLLKAVKYNCSFEIIEFLLKLGSNPNLFNNEGNSPLHYSLSHGNYKITNLLLNHDADETHCNNKGLIPWQCINKNI